MFSRHTVLSTCLLVLAASLGATGCTASTDAEVVADEADELSRGAVPFANTSRPKNGTLGGLAGKTFELSAAMKAKVSELDGSASYGGYYAVAAKFAPEDVQQVIADDATLAKFIAAVASGEASVSSSTDGLTLDSLTRAQLFSHVYDHDAQWVNLDEWTTSDRAAFKSALSVAVRSMLSSPTARTWHLEISQDWTDDAWVSIDPVSGDVRMIVHGGDM